MRRPQILRIEAVTRTQRNEMIARIAEAIQSGGGCILESRFFSNLALFIEAEIAAAKVDQLVAALARTELQLDSRSLAKAHDFAAHWQTGHKPPDLHTIHLFVTFIHTDPVCGFRFRQSPAELPSEARAIHFEALPQPVRPLRGGSTT